MSRRIAVIAGLACGAIAVAMACGFPDPRIEDVLDEAGLPDTSTGEDGGTDAADPDAPVFVGDDSGAVVDANNCKGDPTCDCDDDKDPKPGGSCGGNDCDDFDGKRRSTQTAYVTSVPPDGSTGDWNCDTNEEKFGVTVTGCGGITPPCAQREGWLNSNPACGQPGIYIHCKTSGIGGLDCVEDTSRREPARLRGCR